MEEFALAGCTGSERKRYLFAYLSNACSNVGQGRNPLATAKSTVSFWQIRCLQDQIIKVVLLTADILRSNPAIWTQVRDGAYSMVFVSLEVLLKDASFI
jgi:hypothetical protein